jgi:aminoglycoside N3'-acetyltransferase
MPPQHTQAGLASDLRALGLATGDTVWMHSSLSSLGAVGGGAAAVLGAVRDALGPDGLLLLPSFNLLDGTDLRMAQWDVDSSPSTVGWLTELAHTTGGFVRSDHYSHSCAAAGPGASAFVADHLQRVGNRSPWDKEASRWGRTFGEGSPMLKAYRTPGARLLMLGTLYDSATYMHVVESFLWALMLAEAAESGELPASQQDAMSAEELRELVVFPSINRPALGGFWEGFVRSDSGDSGGPRAAEPVLTTRRVGDAECRLCLISEFVDTLIEEMVRNPQPYLNGREHGQPTHSWVDSVRRLGAVRAGQARRAGLQQVTVPLASTCKRLGTASL